MRMPKPLLTWSKNHDDTPALQHLVCRSLGLAEASTVLNLEPNLFPTGAEPEGSDPHLPRQLGDKLSYFVAKTKSLKGTASEGIQERA